MCPRRFPLLLFLYCLLFRLTRFLRGVIRICFIRADRIIQAGGAGHPAEPVNLCPVLPDDVIHFEFLLVNRTDLSHGEGG
ncbi:hypothetical protein AYY16_00030 [Morganella psychrotolerans]|nr:hypothetical protein AYY16_00030 [Morganella psychrotolerans]